MLGSRLLLSTTFLVACAGSARYRSELVGTGNGMVASRASVVAETDAVAAPGAGGIQLPQGNYELAMRFDIPRAQVIDWKIVCPGAGVDGQVGETFEQYRARRIEELRRDRERERERVATATSIVVGAVAPKLQGNARVGNTNVHAEAHVNAHAGGVAAAHGVVPDAPIDLAPGDVGRGSLAATARVMTSDDGVCVLRVAADDADVRAMFAVTRIRDLRAEESMRRIAAREVAVKARGSLTAQLVTHGADPAVRQRRVDAEAARASAEAAAKLEARARAEAELRAKADLRARHEAAAIYARQEYLAYLTGKCNADPNRRARLEEAETQRREARLVADAALAQRRDELALDARARIRAQLIAFGAKERPPMPAPLEEHPGPAPFTGAEWTAGFWRWTGTTWAWTAGGWSDPSSFGETGGTDVVVDSSDSVVGDDAILGVSVGVGAGVGGSANVPKPGTRDHRSVRERVRDHRDLEDPPKWNPKPSRDEPRTRDHRDSSRPSWEPKDHDKGARVRDHRNDDKKDDKKDDDKPIVRDHRRR